MKKDLLVRLCLIMSVILALYSCHNEDFASQDANSQRNPVDFFKHSKASGGLNAKSGIDYVAILEAYNLEKDFLSTMPDQKGMPIWEKMQVLDVAEKMVLYVPLSSDNTSLSSLLLINLDENNEVSVLRNFTNDYLEKFVYNVEYPANKRKFLMDTFLQMDFLCFGQQTFTNLPLDLYEGVTEYNRLNILEVTKESMMNGKFMYGFLCATVHSCANNCTLSTCDYNDCQHGGKCKVWKSCANTVEWVDDPISSYPSNPSCGPGCGGGGGAIPNPNNPPKPKDPCALNTTFYRVITNCQGGNGNGNDFIGDPCEMTRTLLEDPAVKTKIDSLEKKSKTIGEKAFLYMKDNTASAMIDGGDHEVNITPYSGYKGVYHNHTPAGTYMFSVEDIVTMYKTAVKQLNAATAKEAFVGMVAYETCNCPPNNFVYHNYLLRLNGEFPQAIAIAYSTKEQKNKFEDDYTRLKMELLGIPALRNGPSPIAALSSQGLEQLLFGVLASMNITPDQVVLQKIEKSGSINNINLNPDGTTTPVPCP
jgi:hypothetical protein